MTWFTLNVGGHTHLQGVATSQRGYRPRRRDRKPRRAAPARKGEKMTEHRADRDISLDHEVYLIDVTSRGRDIGSAWVAAAVLVAALVLVSAIGVV